MILVLMIIQIVTWFTILTLQNNQYMQKISRHEWMHGLLLNDALVVLHDIENTIMRDASKCKIETPRNPITKSLPFWQSDETCTGNFNSLQYHYVTEEIGHDPCAQTAITYLRVTLLVLSAQVSDRLLIQSVMIIPDLFPKTCEGPIHHIMMGRQLWREIQ